jgi:hypothetical protein
VAGLGSSLRSPVEAVATEVIDRAPRPVERFAIETFGTNDKLALIVGTLAITAVLGGVFGSVARRRPLAGRAGFAFFALLGVLASAGAPGASALAALPSLAAGVAGAAALRLLGPVSRWRCRQARSPAAAWARGVPSWVPPRPWRPGRR